MKQQSTTTTTARATTVALLLAVVSGCGLYEPKVPITDIGAFFSIADATWFEREETLFFFYRVEASQGLSEFSQIEIAWRTDDVVQEFAPLSSLPMVHEHVAVSCGPRTVCGSASIHVVKPPRNVQMQLRYHKDGELTLDANVPLTFVNISVPNNERSAVVYGVFDENNTAVQWRLRHQFPALRNEEVEALGLRRRLIVDEMGHGSMSEDGRTLFATNVYGYGASATCPDNLYTPLGFAPVETNARAAFAAETMPLSASASSEVCARSTVFDPLGPFSTVAIARKNPEVAAAFPTLRTPVKSTTQIGFFLETCNTISSDIHRAMQLQRTQLSEDDAVCIDDFAAADFVTRLARRFQDRINDVRVAGNDMVLVIGLQRPDRLRAVSVAVEAALALVVEEEAVKSSPRLAGAFVFDSAGYGVTNTAVARNVLWCTSTFGGVDLEEIDNVSARTCAVQANIDIVLGPIRIASLPILPTRQQYLTFVNKFSEAQTGFMNSLDFRAPSRTPQSDNLDLGSFGTATIFNNEAVTAEITDSFSYCADSDVGNVVFRSVFLNTPPLPLSVLPDFHAASPQTRYELGLGWDFPYLAQLNYTTVTAAAVTVTDFTIPFGPSSPVEEFFGSGVWFQETFDLSDVMLRCDRFCSHPTFDNAGVYNVQAFFDVTYRSQCYRPKFPTRSDGGSPLDP